MSWKLVSIACRTEDMLIAHESRGSSPSLEAKFYV
jgi:hypothetical protein